LALALPATAAAQSAGDNQYLDPFANSTPAQTHHSSAATKPAHRAGKPTTTASSSTSPSGGGFGTLDAVAVAVVLIAAAGILWVWLRRGSAIGTSRRRGA
jgi:hypothetical protein